MFHIPPLHGPIVEIRIHDGVLRFCVGEVNGETEEDSIFLVLIEGDGHGVVLRLLEPLIAYQSQYLKIDRRDIAHHNQIFRFFGRARIRIFIPAGKNEDLGVGGGAVCDGVRGGELCEGDGPGFIEVEDLMRGIAHACICGEIPHAEGISRSKPVQGSELTL